MEIVFDDHSAKLRKFSPAVHILMALLLVCAAPLLEETMMAQTSIAAPKASEPLTSAQLNDSMRKLEAELLAKYGSAQKPRLSTGLHQVMEFWRPEDGNASAFESFVRSNFAGDQESLDTMFTRFQRLLEQLDGHMHEINREFRQQMDLDLGTVLPFDEVFAGYDPSAHITDDFFQNRLAFVVLLNFPLTTLEERLTQGKTWDRRQWAEIRLAQRFSKRIPAGVNLAISQASAESERYISEYNIWMYHLLDSRGQRLFPPKMRLLSHWNLRDEIKASYADSSNGLAKQAGMLALFLEPKVDEQAGFFRRVAVLGGVVGDE